MTVQENARFTVFRYVQNYIEGKDNDYWGIIKAIKTALSIESISEGDARMLCNHMHISFKEMMEV